MANLLTTSERDFQNPADWTLTNCTLSGVQSSTGGRPYGTTGPEGYVVASSAGNIKLQLARFVAATPSMTHRCGAWVYALNAYTFGAGIDWYTSAFGYISTSTTNTAEPANWWVPFGAGTPTAPSNAVWAKIWFQALSALSGDGMWMSLGAYAVVDPPWRVHNKGSTLHQSRRARSSLVALPGVRGDTELQVRERQAGRNLSVDVLPGSAYVLGTDIADQGHYYVESDSRVNVPFTDADPLLPRITSIFARVVDSKFSSFAGPPAPDSWGLVAIDGTPAAWPNMVAPAAPASSLRLADVLVWNTSRAIADAYVTDRRAFLQTQGPQIFTLDGSRILLQATTGPWVLMNQQGWAQGWGFIPFAAPFPNKTISIVTTDTGPWGNDGKIRVVTLPGQARNGFWVATTYDGAPYRGWLYLRYTAIGQ